MDPVEWSDPQMNGSLMCKNSSLYLPTSKSAEILKHGNLYLSKTVVNWQMQRKKKISKNKGRFYLNKASILDILMFPSNISCLSHLCNLIFNFLSTKIVALLTFHQTIPYPLWKLFKNCPSLVNNFLDCPTLWKSLLNSSMLLCSI